jgi:hypothetical protein
VRRVGANGTVENGSCVRVDGSVCEPALAWSPPAARQRFILSLRIADVEVRRSAGGGIGARYNDMAVDVCAVNVS